MYMVNGPLIKSADYGAISQKIDATVKHVISYFFQTLFLLQFPLRFGFFLQGEGVNAKNKNVETTNFS